MNDKKNLIDAIVRSDLVINTVGPFYKYENTVVDASVPAAPSIAITHMIERESASVFPIGFFRKILSS